MEKDLLLEKEFNTKYNTLPEKMLELPYEILIKCVKAAKGEESGGDTDDMLCKVYAYGGNDSIKILGELMQEVYKTTGDMQRLKLVSYYLILATQLKYDIIGIRSNPGGFYKMKIVVYESFRSVIDNFHNEIVEKLELEDFLKIK